MHSLYITYTSVVNWNDHMEKINLHSSQGYNQNNHSEDINGVKHYYLFKLLTKYWFSSLLFCLQSSNNGDELDFHPELEASC